MAKPKDEIVNGGSNRSDLVKRVATSFRDYNQLKNERDEINASMGEIRAGWKAMGLSVKGIKAGLARANLEQDQRELFDESYDLAADALGLPIEMQGDFFEDEERFNADPDADGDEPLDGEGEEQDHLSDEERQSQHGDGSEADLGKGLNHGDEQAEGEAALNAGLSQTLGTQH